MTVKELIETLLHCNMEHDVRVRGFKSPVLHESFDDETNEGFVCISDAKRNGGQ